MAKKTKVELVGINDMEKILNQLPKKFQSRVITAALKEATRPLFERAQRNLASVQWGGGLSKYIKQLSRKERGIPGFNIGFVALKRGKRAKLVWRAMGGYWLEYGTMENMTKPREPRTRSLTQAQRNVGVNSKRARVPAHGWLRKAVDTTEKIITDDYRNILWKTLNKNLLRKAKKIKWSGLQ